MSAALRTPALHGAVPAVGGGRRRWSALVPGAAGRIGMLGLAVLAVGALLAGWALTIILTPPRAAAGAAASTTVTVTRGEVGARLALNVAADWATSPVGTNASAGIVTSVDAVDGGMAAQGDRLYSVDGRPVVVAQGDVPDFRMIGEGASGSDVAQLLDLLVDRGFLPAPEGGPSRAASGGRPGGVVGSAEADAIEQWQASLGVPETGEVQLGDVVFVPALPQRLVLKRDVVKRGARLAGGEEVVEALGSAPLFTLPVSEGQSAQIPTGAHVEVTSADGHGWKATVAGRAHADSGSTVVIALDPAGPGPICGDACGTIPVAGQTLLAASVITVETVQGAVVPSVALRSDAQQNLSVVDVAGAEHPVTVTASARGMSVVEGVEPGLVVRIPESATSLDGARAGTASAAVPAAAASAPASAAASAPASAAASASAPGGGTP